MAVARLSCARLLAAAVALALGCASCSGTSAPAHRTSTPGTTAPSGASSPAVPAGTSCLYPITRVARVLAGAWTRANDGSHGCVYSSDRGGEFTVTTVPAADPSAALAEAARRCTKSVPAKGAPHGAFACAASHAEQGRLVVDGKLWLVSVPVRSAGQRAVSRAAVLALLRAAG